MPKKPSSKRKLTRQEQKDLDVEISFIEGVVRRDPGFVDALQVLGDAYTRRGRFIEGLRIDKELSRLRPEDPTVLYNLACSYSLTRQFEKAVASLNLAIQRGYRDFQWLTKDPDLKELRSHPLYKKIELTIKKAKIKIH